MDCLLRRTERSSDFAQLSKLSGDTNRNRSLSLYKLEYGLGLTAGTVSLGNCIITERYPPGLMNLFREEMPEL